MMTPDQYSSFQRSIGVLVGISFCLDNKEITDALLDQCEILDCLIDEIRKGGDGDG